MNNAFKKFDLTGKTALVTGGATGIGYFMSRALAQAGARVTIAARREDVLKDAAQRLTAEAFGNEVRYLRVDLGDRNSIDDVANQLIAAGGVDIYIGNAAQIISEPVDAITNKSLDRMLQVNVSANIQLCRAFLPQMRAKKWGRIIFSSSLTSLRGAGPESNLSTYSTIKGALDAFTRAASTETGRDGITVNSIVMGPFLTELWDVLGEQLDKIQGTGAVKAIQNKLASMSALGRLANCEEVEGVIQLLASNAGSYITGANIVLDGGTSAMLNPNPVTG